MKVATYLRVSTEDQYLENQRIKLKDYIKMRGWDHVKEYSDKISGLKDKRPGLDSLRRDSQKRRFNVVLSVKLDRLGRSLKDLLLFIEQLKHFGIDIAFTDQPIDTTQSMGRFTFQILGAVAELERVLISERTKAGLERARKEGKILGNKPMKISNELEHRILRYKEMGESIRAIAIRCNISIWTVRLTLSKNKDKLQHEKSFPEVVSGSDVKHTEE